MPTTTDTITVRPLGPDDAHAVRDFEARVGGRDSYLRFLEPEARDLTKVACGLARNDPHHVAVGAFVRDRLVAMANYVDVGASHSAEVAMTVAYGTPLCEVGADLLAQLMRLARSHHVERFLVAATADNSTLMRLIRDTDLPVTRCGQATLGVQLTDAYCR